jgi:hydrogenase-4 component B
LALACFVKVFGAVFLGTARSAACDHAHESPLSMQIPMMILASACIIIGLAPWLVVPILDRTIFSWTIESNLQAISINNIVPLKSVSLMSGILIVLIIFISSFVRRGYQRSRKVVTWDCGYACPTNRIQYTASSFAQMIVKIFRLVLKPKMHNPHIEGSFPKQTRMHSHVDDIILDRILIPVSRNFVKWFGWFRRFQQGITQQYLLYILITVILMMSSMIPFKEFITRLFAR